MRHRNRTKPFSLKTEIQSAISRVKNTRDYSRMTSKQRYELLNRFISMYDIEIHPEGENPSPARQIKCGCCSSMFFGLIGVNCCFSSSACNVNNCGC